MNSLLTGLNIKNQEISQIGLVRHIGEGCNSSHNEGIDPAICKQPQLGNTDGAGLKWVDKGCSMRTKGEGTRGTPENRHRAYRA